MREFTMILGLVWTVNDNLGIKSVHTSPDVSLVETILSPEFR